LYTRLLLVAVAIISPSSSSCNKEARRNGASVKKHTALRSNRLAVDNLRMIVPSGINVSDEELLHFALAHPNDITEAAKALKEAIQWRKTAGKHIVNAAQKAVAKAMKKSGWDDNVIRNAAPHANVINDYITSKAVFSTSTEDGKIISVIRTSQIDDKKLMDNASVEQVRDYFLYNQEVIRIEASKLSATTGRLYTVLNVSDVSGTRNAPDRRFTKAVALSCDKYESLYPSNVPVLAVNVPCAGVMRPFFPKSIQERLIFKKAPYLASLQELTPLKTDTSVRAKFVREIEGLV